MQAVKAFFLFITLSSLLIMNANSQPPTKNYEKEWKKVEEFVKQSLPKSALTEVKKIYALAKKEKQEAQVIKSLLYMTGLQQENREDNDVIAIREVEKELSGSKGVVAAILNSLLAEMYWQHYENNRWEMYDRTQTVNFKKEDIATWGAADFFDKTGKLYLLSLKEEKLLQQTKLAPFDAIIVKGTVRQLRPTLYDLLAHRALDYFENDERDVQKPAYAFELNQAAAFDPAADFITHKFPTKDSTSLEHKALLLYQQLIAFHLKDAKADALIDADIRRISFAKEKSVHPDKEELYFNSINHIAHQYENTPAAAQAWYLVALHYNIAAASYQPHGDTTHRFAKLKAKEICEKVIKTQKADNEGSINCYNLLNQLNSRSLQFSVENVNMPGQPFRAFVKYKNFTQLHLRIIPSTDALRKELENQYGDKYWSIIINAKPIKTWEQPLPATNDLQEHSTEIKIDGLPVGEYMLVVATNEKLQDKKTIIGARLFYSSAISFISNTDDFFILNRDNGQPLANAAVQLWEQKYDYSTSKYVKQKGKLYKTDINGAFKREKEKQDNNNYRSYSYLLDITHGTDRLFMNELINDYYYYRDNQPTTETHTSIFLFTDRGLYRPGQTLFFKGIVLAKSNTGKRAAVRSGYKTKIYLRDANHQNVDSMQVTTNEFGSFTGKFQLPSSGLNGQFAIYTKPDNAEAGFKVEEYKRPKFYAEYEPLKGTYQVNDKIKVTGAAKAYAGNNIDGALVKYRVVRQPRFIYPWLFYRWWQPPVNPLEIVHGETKTDKEGKFVVEFTAIPDLKIEKKLEPVFDYTVYADITDINGETRSAEQTVSVSYKALQIQSSIPATLPADSLHTLYIRTENMNGQFEPATVSVSISQLKEEKRLIRDRYWQRPDQFVMTKGEYISYFPNDEYDNETDNKSWEKAALMMEITDSAKTTGQFKLTNKKFLPGFYVIEISSKDKNGEPVKDIQYIELYDEKSKQLNSPQHLWLQGVRSIEPGEKISVQLGSSANDLFVIQQINKQQDKTASYSFVKLNNEKKAIEFTATEEDRGGYGASWAFVKHNRIYQQQANIYVPWSNKELTVEYATYRDKTLPGSEEKWKVKISGYKKEKVAAEMLASMYDASLDQFYPFNWNKPYIWTTYYNQRYWNGSQNFAQVQSQQKAIDEYEYKAYNKVYDGLLSFNQVEYDMPGGFINNKNHKIARVLKSTPSVVMDQSVAAPPPSEEEAKKEIGIFDSGELYVHGNLVNKGKPSAPSSDIQIRKNFNETAFFLPELRTDSSGAIEFSFTLPETLTKWKFQALVHSKELAFGYSSKEIITQKELMVQPNAPRFMREGDKMEFSTKVVNLTDKELTGYAQFQLFDAATNEPVDGIFLNQVANQYFTVAAGQSEAVKFPIEVPYQFNKALTWRIIAKADTFSDGEENSLPVLTNRMLVTESLSLPMKGTGSKNFQFDKLLKSGASETLQQHALTVEYTSNPAWYAIQALPYLMEYPYDCAEQTWNRYYANSLAAMIANSSPKIKAVFEKWKTTDTAALISNLQKNQELKAVLLEETPWVLDAKNEAAQKRNIALLFDMIRMSQQLNSSFEKLQQLQSSNGGFVWFKGGPDDRYMTQYIITSIGHLKKLNGVAAGQEDKLKQLLSLAIPYLDKKIKEDYDNLVKYKTDLKKYTPGYSQVQYLYMRSFFSDYKIAASSQTAVNYFRSRLPLTWTTQNKYMQGMTALLLHRNGDSKTPAAILKSLKEKAISNEELGMYWKDAARSWWWYEAPIERQALLIEAFQEISKDYTTVDNLRTWLLKNKQTNKWESTKATAEACYALLLQGNNWLSNEPIVEISLGKTTISSADNAQEAGTGYFKKTIEGVKVKPEMGNISVKVTDTKQTSPASKGASSWGGVYWQYFEDLDKITTAATPLKLNKKLFIEKNGDRGPVLSPINDGDAVKVGDKIKVRIELRVDRDMEYVHMKDMRASALEPVNVLSTYKWQGGLGYYETTKDASTNFFFGSLQKGTYVFEYSLFVTHTGNFSNGITSIQCMYAPEFSSHSEGIHIRVE